MCEFQVRPVLSPQNGVRSTYIIYTHISYTVCINVKYLHIYMWGNHLLSRFFWLVKCPKSSTNQILNANGIILTLRAWQRPNSIVYQHKDCSFKSNQVKLLEMIWNDMKCKDSSPKWYEMIWKDVSKRIWKDTTVTKPNICKGLFTRMIGVPFLMWQGQTHATVSGHFSSVYNLAWPKSSKDHSDMLYKFHNIL